MKQQTDWLTAEQTDNSTRKNSSPNRWSLSTLQVSCNLHSYLEVVWTVHLKNYAHVSYFAVFWWYIIQGCFSDDCPSAMCIFDRTYHGDLRILWSESIMSTINQEIIWNNLMSFNKSIKLHKPWVDKTVALNLKENTILYSHKAVKCLKQVSPSNLFSLD